MTVVFQIEYDYYDAALNALVPATGAPFDGAPVLILVKESPTSAKWVQAQWVPATTSEPVAGTVEHVDGYWETAWGEIGIREVLAWARLPE